MISRQLDVYLDVDGAPQLIANAWFSQRRGGPVTTVFAYEASFLSTAGAQSIDPNLQLVTGNQYIEGLPGAFQDCSPDRWGRNLIQKRHRLTASDPGSGQLNDLDYLVGVSDATRQGALRFTEPGGTHFLNERNDVPKLIELPQLLNASKQVVDQRDELSAVKALLDAGSGSLGGARPKASVRGQNGELLIAKFPHQSDEWDVMAWECLALNLAERANITVPERDLVKVDKHNVLLLRRFDRDSDENRIPYLSAMSLLAARDGDWHDYTEIADAISDYGSNPRIDLADLYRRVAFSVAIHNTDDHLRNHGFVRSRGAWTLAPAFDINPNPEPASGRVTGIAGATDRSQEAEGLQQLATHCRLTNEATQGINKEVVDAVAQWRRVADSLRIKPEEQQRFAQVLDATS